MSTDDFNSPPRGYHKAPAKIRALRFKRMMAARRRGEDEIARSPARVLIRLVKLAMLLCALWALWMFISMDLTQLHYPVGTIIFGFVFLFAFHVVGGDE